MGVLFTLTTTAWFERRDSAVVIDRDDLAALLEAEGFRVDFEPEHPELLPRLHVYGRDGVYESHLSVDPSGSLGWKGGASLDFKKLVVGWYVDLVARREDVWLYSDSGDLCLRLSPDTYLEDLARIHEGWQEQRDLPPGLDLG